MASWRQRLAVPLRAVHVNHGLQAPAAEWAEHCRRVCEALAVPLTVLEVKCDLSAGASVEDAARRARYQAFEQELGKDEWLLLAHHQDDQAETVLLRLLRGAGVHGLAAMPEKRQLGRGKLFRPLLNVPAAAIVAYADRHALTWIEDPSNRDPRYDRNFLRYLILPQLAERWPNYQAPVIRAAEHARDAAELVDALAELDLAQCRGVRGLDVAAVQNLSAIRQQNVVRLWLRRQGLQVPSQRRLQAGLQALLQAERDRQPLLEWGGQRLRRFRQELVLEPAVQKPTQHVIDWDLAQPLTLPGGCLEAHPGTGDGLLREDIRQQQLEVRFRRGGERCKLAGEAHHRSLKKLLQEQGLPPWERDCLPLLYVDGELAAIADLWVCEGFQAPPGSTGIQLNYIVDQGGF